MILVYLSYVTLVADVSRASISSKLVGYNMAHTKLIKMCIECTYDFIVVVVCGLLGNTYAYSLYCILPLLVALSITPWLVAETLAFEIYYLAFRFPTRQWTLEWRYAALVSEGSTGL